MVLRLSVTSASDPTAGALCQVRRIALAEERAATVADGVVGARCHYLLRRSV